VAEVVVIAGVSVEIQRETDETFKCAAYRLRVLRVRDTSRSSRDDSFTRPQ